VNVYLVDGACELFRHYYALPSAKVKVTTSSALANTLCEQRGKRFCFVRWPPLRTDIKLFDDVEQLRRSGPRPEFDALAARLDAAKG
jgi:hypothetical protein